MPSLLGWSRATIARARRRAADARRARSGALSERVTRARSRAARRSASASRARSPREPRALLDGRAVRRGRRDRAHVAAARAGRASSRSCGTTTLFVTHDVDEAFRLADRIVVMRDGRLEQAATPGELFERPATPLRARSRARRRRRLPATTSCAGASCFAATVRVSYAASHPSHVRGA